MAGFYIDQAAVLRPRCVERKMRVAKPASGGVAAVFILKPSLEHQEFFAAAAAMGMGHKPTVWRKAHKAGRACNFTSDAVKHHPDDTYRRRGNQGMVLRASNDTLVKFCIHTQWASIQQLNSP